MLVLSRKRQQTICIGGQIEVKVLEVRGNSVRLGISAPPEVPVHREEVHQKLRSQTDNRSAPLHSERTAWASPVLSRCG